MSPWLPLLPDPPSLRDGGEEDDELGGALFVLDGGCVGCAVDVPVTVVFLGPPPLSFVCDGGAVEEDPSVVDEGGSVDEEGADVEFGVLLVVVGGASVEVGGRLVEECEVGGGGGVTDVVAGGDVSAGELGTEGVDVLVGGSGDPVCVGLAPIPVELEDIVNRRSNVSRRRGGLYMAALASASIGDV